MCSSIIQNAPVDFEHSSLCFRKRDCLFVGTNLSFQQHAVACYKRPSSETSFHSRTLPFQKHTCVYFQSCLCISTRTYKPVLSETGRCFKSKLCLSKSIQRQFRVFIQNAPFRWRQVKVRRATKRMPSADHPAIMASLENHRIGDTRRGREAKRTVKGCQWGDKKEAGKRRDRLARKETRWEIATSCRWREKEENQSGNHVVKWGGSC